MKRKFVVRLALLKEKEPEFESLLSQYRLGKIAFVEAHPSNFVHQYYRYQDGEIEGC
jgi:hypothetical protein